MGCCESREVKSIQRSIKNNRTIEFLNVPLISEAKMLQISHLREKGDTKALEIVEYIDELNRANNWKNVKNDGWIKIQKIDGSKYNPDYPVSKIWFHLEERLPLYMILDHLNSPIKRVSWDKNFKSYEIIDGDIQNCYTLYYSLSLLGYKGDYIEKRIIGIHNHMVVVVYYSVDHELKPEIKQFSRGVIHIGFLTIEVVDGRTELCFYNQVDPNYKLSKLFAHIGVSKSDEWCKKFKNILIRSNAERKLISEEYLEIQGWPIILGEKS
ncbi:unnamed protein product [Blepharisma stoltei]|uniref:START domain-containing protein n=1 Tax=Blepharisma stoltei TaxID=1481888 RepID=A0AAU9JII7_9CILI|nr:unnamed protein product [Blepharisma stoltei]